MDKKFNRIIVISLMIIGVIAFIEALIYFNLDGVWKYSDYGTFGDFLGGTLNPILAFFSIILILYTVRQNQQALKQNEEHLKNSIEELKLTRVELKETKEIQLQQSKSLRLQNFDQKFFSMFDIYKQLSKKLVSFELDGVKFIAETAGNPEYIEKYQIRHTGLDALFMFKNNMKECISNYDSNLNNIDGIHSYSSFLKIFLIYINEYKLKPLTKERYFDILLTQFDLNEKMFLLVLSSQDRELLQVRRLIEMFEELEKSYGEIKEIRQKNNLY